MFKSVVMISLIAGALNVSSSAFAAPEKPRYHRLDINKDGVVSRDEAAARPKLAAKFAQLDTNRDGVLSRAELNAARKPRAERAPRAAASGSGMGERRAKRDNPAG
jgi:EF hand